GKFLSPPRIRLGFNPWSPGDPYISVRCHAGQFYDAYVNVFAVLDKGEETVSGFTTVYARLDDDTTVLPHNFELSKDYRAFFIQQKDLLEWLNVHRLIIGAEEAFASRIVMQFDMTDDLKMRVICNLPRK